ncbi:hypothetical protein KC19_4G003700 [Ceratodon purpureus]|uniref:Secreted protein n=1 Tax=Ceratodon purpureus TaxID=3225 RepID=A0A8T0I3V1_CERPU|nr:hypothetical protein KC19_4G003700 [Ceratodon purpureus]
MLHFLTLSLTLSLRRSIRHCIYSSPYISQINMSEILLRSIPIMAKCFWQCITRFVTSVQLPCAGTHAVLPQLVLFNSSLQNSTTSYVIEA